MAAASSSSASAATRRRSLAPWLLLALWSRIAAALRRWFLRLVRRPLLRFGFGGAPRYRLKMDDADDDNGGVVGSAIGSSEDNWARVDGAAGRQLSSDELPLGLANLGNICFANAVVQCLRVVPGFVERLVAETARTRAEALEGGDDDARAKQWRVADALCDVLDGIAPDCANPQDDSEPADDKDGVLVGHSVVKERDPDARREQNVSMLRYFRQEASRCSYLVAAVSAEQEQQDAEVRALPSPGSYAVVSRAGWVVGMSNRSSCPSCWSCCTTCSTAATSWPTTSRSAKPSGWGSC